MKINLFNQSCGVFRIFNSTIDRNTKKFRIEIVKSIPQVDLVLDYNGQGC